MTPVPGAGEAPPGDARPAPPVGAAARQHPGLRWRRAATAVALLAGLGAAGLAGGHVLGTLGAHGGAGPGQYEHHGHGDDDGVVFAPLPAPIAPPAPGR
jgi:hypothetical protein